MSLLVDLDIALKLSETSDCLVGSKYTFKTLRHLRIIYCNKAKRCKTQLHSFMICLTLLAVLKVVSP